MEDGTTVRGVGPAPAARPVDVATLARSVSYEVMPFKGTEAEVGRWVPREVPLTVTATESKGLETTIALTERLAAAGYDAAPHLAARLFESEAQLVEVVERLSVAGVGRLFVIGGDAPQPLGPFHEAQHVLVALAGMDHSFEGIGIGGYPEGHALIDDDAITDSLTRKAPHADRLITQMCFDASATARWAADLARQGVALPIHVGLPGPVNRQKLVRISAGLGLGQSARFLEKQKSLFWRFLLPGGYSPTRLVKKLGSALREHDTHVEGLHIFTFNELEGTERWRQKLLASVR